MDLWVWIAIFIVAWLLEALASAAKNKQRQQQQQPQRQPRVQGTGSPPQTRRAPPPQPPVPRQPPRTVSVLSPRRAPPLPPALEGQVTRAPRVRELERTTAAEGVSAEVEVVEPGPESTEESHTRVTEKYRGPAPGEIGGEEQQRPPRRFALRPRTAREAVVWMEILGPPKSER